MLNKLPIIGFPIKSKDILYSLTHMRKESVQKEFIHAVSGFMQSRYMYLTNSGISSFYIILSMLKKDSKKREVILPAYTATSLVLTVLEAGLKPVLCDISLEDFNSDMDALLKIVSQETLVVVCVHMFGIGAKYIEELRAKIPQDVFLIEDCAQAMGSKIGERQAGSFGDISFFSFNRGKNLPTYGGGCIFTNKVELAEKIEAEAGMLEKQSFLFKLALPFKMAMFSLAVRPYIYGIFYPAISHFKGNQVPERFFVREYTNFQAGLGLCLLKKIDEFSEKRYQNGMTLINGLSYTEDIILPTIAKDTRPAFNRLPVVFKYIDLKEKVEKALWKAGIDTSRMYLKPLHHIFNLGYKREDFPNANYFAERLLTLPVHPMVQKKDIEKIINVIKGVRT